MKRLLETLKSARWIEALLLAALLCILLVVVSGNPVYEESREGRIARTLSSIRGAGEVQVLLNGDEEIKGVVVLAEGAGDISVMLSLQRSVQTLTGLPLSKIEVLASE